MKKLIPVFVFFMLILASVKSQVRLSEINDQDAGSGDFIELFSPSTSAISLDGYHVLVRRGGSSAITSCFDLSGKNIGGATAAAQYFVIGSLAGADYTVATPDFLSNRSGDINLVFLLKNGRIIDFFASRTSKNDAIALIRATPTFTLCGSGGSIVFGNVQLADYSTTNAQLGARGKSYTFQTSSTASCGDWSKQDETPNATNAGGNPTFQYFSAAIEYPGTADATSWVDITTNGNNTLPSPSFAITGTSVSRTIQIRYVISETNIPVVSGTTPSVQIWTDKNPDGILDEVTSTGGLIDVQLSNPEYTVAAMSTVGSGATIKYIFNISIPVTSNLKNLSGFLNSLYFKFTSGGSASVPCFISITAMNFGEQALPVQLSNFVVKNDVNKNQLSWKTSSETNNKGFEIQRSMGNTNEFKTIGFVGTKAKQGNSESEISYSFEDADVKPGQTHYYRLNQIDFDGKSAFSPVKSIKPGSIESNLSVYPNPNQGSFTVNTGSTSGKLNIFVMDNTGRVVNQYMNVSTTNTRINNLKKGFYTLKIVNTESGEQSAQRVVVQ
jgi:hypothetical protein